MTLKKFTIKDMAIFLSHNHSSIIIFSFIFIVIQGFSLKFKVKSVPTLSHLKEVSNPKI